MHLSIKRLASGLLLSLSIFAFSGCGGDSSTTATGPSSSGFGGAGISINPDIAFTDGTNCTYTNVEVGSPFPDSPAATAGTYTYAPAADFKSGTLTLTLGAPVSDTLIFAISSFVQTAGNVTGFRAQYDGRTYPVTVTSGTIPAQVVTPPAGGGGAETPADPIPASMQGTYDLNFHEANTGSGIANGTATQFVISANTLTFGGKTLSNPVYRSGNKLEWIFKDGALEYAASIAMDDSLNEINVGGAGGGKYYGQYNDRPMEIVPGTPTGGASNVGSYTGAISLADEGITGRGPNTPILFAGNQIIFALFNDTLLFAELNVKVADPVTLSFDPTSPQGHNFYVGTVNGVAVKFVVNFTGDTVTSCSITYTETDSSDVTHVTRYVVQSLTKS